MGKAVACITSHVPRNSQANKVSSIVICECYCEFRIEALLRCYENDTECIDQNYSKLLDTYQ